MHILNYGLANPEWFFQLWMFCIFFYFELTLLFMYYRKHQSRRLPDAPIQKFIGSTNPKIYRIIIRNTKKKCTVYRGTVLSLRNLVGVQEESADLF